MLPAMLTVRLVVGQSAQGVCSARRPDPYVPTTPAPPHCAAQLEPPYPGIHTVEQQPAHTIRARQTGRGRVQTDQPGSMPAIHSGRPLLHPAHSKSLTGAFAGALRTCGSGCGAGRAAEAGEGLRVVDAPIVIGACRVWARVRAYVSMPAHTRHACLHSMQVSVQH